MSCKTQDLSSQCCPAPTRGDGLPRIEVPAGAHTFRVSVAINGVCGEPTDYLMAINMLGREACNPLIVYESDGVEESGALTFLLDKDFLGLPNIRYEGRIYKRGGCAEDACSIIELDKEVVCFVTGVAGQGGVDFESMTCES